MASLDCSHHPELHSLFLLNKPRVSTMTCPRIHLYLPETLHNTSPFPTHPFCSCSQGLCTSHSLPAAFQWPAMISKSASLECLTTTVYYSHKFWCHLSGAPNKQQHCHRVSKHTALLQMLFQSRETPFTDQHQGYRLPLLFMWWYFHSTLKIKMIQYKAKLLNTHCLPQWGKEGVQQQNCTPCIYFSHFELGRMFSWRRNELCKGKNTE